MVPIATCSPLTVADAFERDAVLVHEHEPVHTLLAHLGSREQSVFPVIDDQARLIGVLAMIEIGAVARANLALDAVVITADKTQPTEIVAPGNSLLEAVLRMGVRGDGSLPVIDPESERVLGVVHRAGVLALYERSIDMEMPRAWSTPPAGRPDHFARIFRRRIPQITLARFANRVCRSGTRCYARHVRGLSPASGAKAASS